MTDEPFAAIVELAKLVFGAVSASIALHDAGAHELVFRAVSGPEADELLGSRFRASEGIAGQVVASGTAMCVDDLGSEPHFAEHIATETRYVPESIICAPILTDGDVRGVISVLDRTPRDGDIALLQAFAAITARLTP